jgi:hypothetical protein
MDFGPERERERLRAWDRNYLQSDWSFIVLLFRDY